MTDLDFETSIAVWGCHIAGDTAEPTAWMCESRNGVPPPMDRWRDRTAGEIARWSYNGAPVPEYWALPSVTALRVQRDVDFWDIVDRLAG